MLIRATQKCNAPGFRRRGYFFPLEHGRVLDGTEVDVSAMSAEDKAEFARCVELGYLEPLDGSDADLTAARERFLKASGKGPPAIAAAELEAKAQRDAARATPMPPADDDAGHHRRRR
jgi:hypothetical protein